MDETSLLDWFGSLIALNGSGAALKLAKTREGFVAKFGSFTSAPSPDFVTSLVGLREMVKKAMTVGP